jgi:cytochrome c553
MKRALLSVGFVALFGIVGMAWADGNVQAGKARAGSCGGCHGTEGQGIPPSPALAGMKKDRFVQAMKDYQSGKRENAMMKSLAKPLGKDDIEDLAAYYASLKAK